MANNENIHDLGHGFKVELVRTVPDEKGCDIEGYLYFKDEAINIAQGGRLYENNVEALEDFNNRIIPAYVTKNDVKEIKYLKGPEVIEDFVKKYLLKNKKNITYGTTLDVIKILNKEGYQAPDESDTTQVHNLLEYYKCIDSISAELKKQLVMFGFPADRNRNDTTDHVEGVSHLRCKNLVYTRYLWINGFKAIKVVKDFLKTTENDLTAGTDMVTLEKKSQEVYEVLTNVTTALNTVHYVTKDGVTATNFNDYANEFKDYIRNNKSELIKVWSRRRPKNYGVYKD